MSHRKHVHALGTLLFAAALAACSSSTSPTAAGAPPAEQSPSRPAATGASPAAGSPTPGPGPRFLTKNNLTAALLPLSEMPAGWSAGKSDGAGANRAFCDYQQPHDAEVQATGNFRKGAGTTASVAAFGLRQYATPSDAAEVFDAMEQALRTCHKETYKGSVRTYAAMNVAKLGDRSLGVRVESDGYTLLQQFTLDGPALISAGIGGTAHLDAHTAALLLRQQVDHYEAAAVR
ncbi:hypothetical protein ACFWVC_29885 [Streptomyces sp. NPDC058691]|uniref:hypothetical protein n=1 Tax=Streptomyces sp. NPDC058691 TaxID=3346601 RepID=UPI00364C076D